jgi:hypothetical protein
MYIANVVENNLKKYYTFYRINYLRYMKEIDLNRIINKSLKEVGFSHKIADGVGGIGSQNPYDLYSVIPMGILNIESKLIKNKVQAFNFNRIEDHQLENLLAIDSIVKEWYPKPCQLIALGIYIPRKLYVIIFFDIQFIKNRIDLGDKSIKKKELETFIQNSMYLTIHRVEGNYKIKDLARLKDVIVYD